MDRSYVARGLLAAGAAAYAVSVAVASQHPGPRAWALHLPGFLPPPARFLVMALLFGAALLLVVDLLRPGASGPSRPEGAPRRSASRDRPSRQTPGTKPLRLPRWSGWLLLLPWAWILWELRVRTLFLGDGTIWLGGIQSGRPSPFSEPLSAATWSGYASILRTLGFPVVAPTVGALSILAGVVAAAILWGIASELTPRTGSRAFAFAVLATLGLAQLYFGYIESYPLASVAILAYLWLGLRRARGADHPLWLATALAIAMTLHLVAGYLVPSYLYLALREKRPLHSRAVLALLPLAGAAAILLFLGFKPSQWLVPLNIVARAVQPGHDIAVFAKPYTPLSLGHAWELLNAILLVLPVPGLLLIAAAAGRGVGRDATAPSGPDADAATVFLAAAALPGLITAIVLVLPVPPAQDWDLASIMVLPLAVLGVKVGCSIPKVPLRGTRGVALVLLGAGATLSLVLVNANETSGVHRFETLVGPGAKITAYGRAYGNELLASYYEDRNDYSGALVHAQRAREAEPTNPRYWVKTGAALYNLHRYDEAIPVLEEGIRRGPNRDDAYYDLGNCFTRKGRYDAAAASYREAIRLAGPSADYLNNLGVALYSAGESDSARLVWTDVVRRWPGYGRSRRALLRHFGGLGSDSGGVSSMRR